MIALANADSRRIPLSDQSAQCVITSPPYWGLRDYGHSDQIGLEATPALYVASIVSVMREVYRVLKDDGVLWLNLGDSYAGGKGQSGTRGAENQEGRNKRGESLNRGYQTLGGAKQTKPTDDKAALRSSGLKPKDLVGIPWRVAFALQDDGWYLRSDIIWHKLNPMPESVTDRPTKSHEYVFLLTKQARYFYDAEAIKETSETIQGPRPFGGAGNGKQNTERHDYMYQGDNGTRNRRSVWTIATSPYSGAHFATFPPALVEPMVLAGTSARGECPVCGKAWVRVVEDSPEYAAVKARMIGKTHEDTSKELERGKQQSWGRDKARVTQDVNTVGWRPQCDCARADWYWCEDCNISKPISELTHGCPQCGETMTPAPYDPVPQIVLDPFAGSGTVGQVCRSSGRSFVGFDLSLKYLHNNAMPRAQNTNTAASMATLPMFAEAQL
jgi:DNA modification methylase